MRGPRWLRDAFVAVCVQRNEAQARVRELEAYLRHVGVHVPERFNPSANAEPPQPPDREKST